MDNRFVKTTKVSAFFNGNGEENIVWANGLDHFTKTKSETYRDKLRQSCGQDNGQFDCFLMLGVARRRSIVPELIMFCTWDIYSVRKWSLPQA